MAQPAIDTSSPSVPGGDPVSDALGIKEVTTRMADNQREKIAAEDKVIGGLDSTINRSIPQIEELSKKAGVEAEKLKPWDADAEAAKRRTDPIEAFGSFGSVFGILASAFTHAPMENALNASAAAMQAIKAGDKESYDRAQKGWEDNLKMTLDRHKIQHDAYQDAVSLLNVNMRAAQTKLQVLAARFGDKQVQTLLDAGMNKEVEDLFAARHKNAEALAENQVKVLEQNAIMGQYLSFGGDPKNPQSEKSQAAWAKVQQTRAEQKAAERAYTPEQQAYAQFIKQNPNATAEQIRDFVTELRNKSKGGAGGGNQNLTIERQIAAEAARLKKEKMDAGMPEGQAVEESLEEASKLRRTAAAPSGNKLDQMKSIYDRAGMMSETIDKADALLAKHKGLTGLGGTVTRPMEAVSNVFGSNATDRAQFRRYVSELQEWGSRVLNESAGRPLSAEVSKLAAILPGLSMGDTTANTVRAYRELKPLIATIQAQMKKRMEGTWNPETSPGAGSATPGGSWQPPSYDKKAGQ